jgi:hypothetical protein
LKFPSRFIPKRQDTFGTNGKAGRRLDSKFKTLLFSPWLFFYGPVKQRRLEGRNRIRRAFYVTAPNRCVVIVQTFIMKTEKIPKRAIETAIARSKSTN